MPFESAMPLPRTNVPNDAAKNRTVRRYAFAGSVREQNDTVPTVELDAPKDLFKRVSALRRSILIKAVFRSSLTPTLLPHDLIPDVSELPLFDDCYTKNELRAASRAVTMPGFTSDPDWAELLKRGLSGIAGDLRVDFDLLPLKARQGAEGEEVLARFEAISALRVLAERFADVVRQTAEQATDSTYRNDLARIEKSLLRLCDDVPRDFTDAVLFLWIVSLSLGLTASAPMTLSLGRLDAILAPFYRRSMDGGVRETFCRELLYRFLYHIATLNGDRPIPVTLFTSSDADEVSLSSAISEMVLDPDLLGHIRPVIAMPIVPDDALVSVILAHAASANGAFLRFGMRESFTSAISESVGALPAQTVYDGFSISFLDVLEQTLGNGKPLDPNASAPLIPKKRRIGDFEALYDAFLVRLKQSVRTCADDFGTVFNSMRERPLSALRTALHPKNAACFALLTGTEFIPTVHALLGIRRLVFEQEACTLAELTTALTYDWEDASLLCTSARSQTPQLFFDNAAADLLALRVLRDFAGLVADASLRINACSFLSVIADRPHGATPFHAFTSDAVPALSAAAFSFGTILGGHDEHGVPDSVLSGGWMQTLALPRVMRYDPSYRSALADLLSGYAVHGGASLHLMFSDADGAVKSV